MQICCKNMMIKSNIESLESVQKFSLNSTPKQALKLRPQSSTFKFDSVIDT